LDRGIRSCSGAISAFGPVVMIAYDPTGSLSSPATSSHSPAKATSGGSVTAKMWGTFLPPACYHSSNPAADTGQRRFLTSGRNIGLLSKGSARALIGATGARSPLAVHRGRRP